MTNKIVTNKIVTNKIVTNDPLVDRLSTRGSFVNPKTDLEQRTDLMQEVAKYRLIAAVIPIMRRLS